jgi:glucarate dehydratase
MKITDIRATPCPSTRHAAKTCEQVSLGSVRSHDRRNRDRRPPGLVRWAAVAKRSRRLQALKPYLLGRIRVASKRCGFDANPTASLYNNRIRFSPRWVRLPRHPRPEMGRAGVRYFGGRLRDHVPFASYLFFRYPNRGRLWGSSLLNIGCRGEGAKTGMGSRRIS